MSEIYTCMKQGLCIYLCVYNFYTDDKADILEN